MFSTCTIRFFSGWVTVAAILAAGCADTGDNGSGAGAAVANSAWLLPERPADAVGVEQARSNSQSEEQVSVEGRIGGSPKPFVDGIAAFTLVDTSLEWCADDEGCPTPWDYCCSDKSGKMATVKVVGADGEPVATDARKLLGVRELSLVVVRGTAVRDEQGNLTVLADKVHVAAR